MRSRSIQHGTVSPLGPSAGRLPDGWVDRVGRCGVQTACRFASESRGKSKTRPKMAVTARTWGQTTHDRTRVAPHIYAMPRRIGTVGRIDGSPFFRENQGRSRHRSSLLQEVPPMTRTVTVQAQQRWDYSFESRRTETSLLTALNDLGQQGWEVVNALYYKDIKGIMVWGALLKRPSITPAGKSGEDSTLAARPAPRRCKARATGRKALHAARLRSRRRRIPLEDAMIVTV